MKTLKMNFGAIALLLGCMIAVGSSAFTSAKTAETWHFMAGKGSGDINDPSAYEAVTGGESCDNATATLPCVISFDEGDYSSLTDYLGAKSASQVIQGADATRSN